MKKILLILSVILSSNSLIIAQVNRLSEQAGNITKVSSIAGGYAFELTNAYAQILAYNSTTLRVRVTKTKPDRDQSYAIDDLTPKGKFVNKEEGTDEIRLYTDSLTAVIRRNPFRVTFINKTKQVLNADEDALGISWFGSQVSCYKKLNKDEKFIGLGEKTGNLNRRGSFYQHWNTDNAGYGLNQDPLYSTIPFFIGIHDKVVYGIFFDNTYHSYFNFGGGADEELFHFGADDGEMNYYFFGGNTVPDILKNYTALTGRTPMPPLWSLGFQQSRWGYDSQDQLLSVAKTLRDKKLPADVIVCDINYMDNYKVFTWNPQNFTSVKGMMTDMKKMGFDVYTIIDPGIKIEKGYKAYEEGVTKNLFAKYPGGRLYVGSVWPGRCNFPDFTKAETQKWWGRNFKEPYVDNGIRGFWNDMNEPAVWGKEIPNLIEFGEGADKATLFKVKNTYGLLMAKATYEGTKALMNGQRPFNLTRAAYSGIQKYSAQWTGDNVSSDEHMMLGFRLLNSMGVSGIPYVGMDIGGFIGDPSPELFIRWMSLGVYSPLFRNHTHINNNFREPWLFGEANTNTIRSILEQRYKILPYLYSTFYEAHENGLPINRMLPISYTSEKQVYYKKYQNQFLFGEQMMVSPVESNTLAVETYFPGDQNWYRLSTDEVFAGGKAQFVSAPLTDLPVFVKAGAILPMQSVIQNTKEKGDGLLYLHIYKGNRINSFVYYEDDGETFNYEKGNFYKRTMTYDPAGILSLAKKEGTYTSKFSSVKVIMHGFNTVSNVNINGAAVSTTNEGKTITFTSKLSDADFTIKWK